ncbi:MAG TPA: thiosulfate oxidation carrier protein SoxY [Rhodocyclaceae bacterium]|nr:thiosulfate oxidation carrier protein SoxY [Rhodocyclaceae bacterium]
MDKLRRMLLKGTGASGALAAALAAGVLKPGQVFAADWNKAAFDAKDIDGALKGAGVSGAADSKDVTIKAPDIAENGAVVPIEVASNVPKTQQIMVFIEKNPTPLAASFDLQNGTEPSVSLRVKMGQTSNIKVVAKADGKFYTTAKEVKVTIGGCGG